MRNLPAALVLGGLLGSVLLPPDPPQVLGWTVTHHLSSKDKSVYMQRRVSPASDADVAFVAWDSIGVSLGTHAREAGVCWFGSAHQDPFFATTTCHQILHLEMMVRAGTTE